MDSWVIVQGEAALTAFKNFPVVLESRGTMVVSWSGTSGQRDPHNSTEEMPTEYRTVLLRVLPRSLLVSLESGTLVYWSVHIIQVLRCV